MPRIPPIPKQLTLACCQPPSPAVPDWETLKESTRTAVQATLARLMVRLATESRDGCEHE